MNTSPLVLEPSQRLCLRCTLDELVKEEDTLLFLHLKNDPFVESFRLIQLV